jgi:signal peptidase I
LLGHEVVSVHRFPDDPQGEPPAPTHDRESAPEAISPPVTSAPYVDAWDQYAAGARRGAARGSAWRTARETVQVVLVALLLFAGTRTVVQGREIRGPSMLPTYHTGQRLFVTRYFFHDPKRGDVVVFHPPSPSSDDYIKRVVGVPGDRVQVRGSRVFVNGELVAEPYLADGVQTACSGRWCDVVLGPDQYYVMGDNRPNSSDSRLWGPVDEGQIVGKAWLLYYPFSDFGWAP